MNSKSEHIHPVVNQLLTREDKEKLLKQKGKVFWFTGLSGSGKTTIAHGLEAALHAQGHLVMALDGDSVRTGINNNLGFSDDDRKENIRRVAEVAKLFVNCGVVTLCTFVSPTKQIRALAKSIIGENDFEEIYVNTSLAECERRDVKGLYAKARKGEVKEFTGVSAPFEAPENAALEIKTENKTIEQSVNEAFAFVLQHVKK